MLELRDDRAMTPLAQGGMTFSGHPYHYQTRETSKGVELYDGLGRWLDTFASVREARSFAIEEALPQSREWYGGYKFDSPRR